MMLLFYYYLSFFFGGGGGWGWDGLILDCTLSIGHVYKILLKFAYKYPVNNFQPVN